MERDSRLLRKHILIDYSIFLVQIERRVNIGVKTLVNLAINDQSNSNNEITIEEQ